MTAPTGWDQSDGFAPDSPLLGVLALVIAVPSALCAFTYFFSPLTFLGAVLALPLGALARGVPRSRRLGTSAIVLTVAACAIATAGLVSLEG